MVAERRLEWRSTALDLPLALLIVLVLGQLALGNRPLVRWALAPAGAPDSLPSLFLALGTVAPAHTARSLLLLLTYAGTYLLVVNLVRTRAQLDRLVGTLLAFGGLLAFLGLLDYLGREAWLLRWRGPATGRLSGTFVNPDHFAAWLDHADLPRASAISWRAASPVGARARSPGCSALARDGSGSPVSTCPSWRSSR